MGPTTDDHGDGGRAAGWYPGPGGEWYFDGAAWSDYRSGPPVGLPPPPERRRVSRWRIARAAVAAAIPVAALVAARRLTGS